jgi:hypothetical protein
MKYVDEYRDGEAAGKLADAIARAVTRPCTIMEVCGGQTHTIVKYGIDHLLPPLTLPSPPAGGEGVPAFPSPPAGEGRVRGAPVFSSPPAGGEGRVRGASSWSTARAARCASLPWK